MLDEDAQTPEKVARHRGQLEAEEVADLRARDQDADPVREAELAQLRAQQEALVTLKRERAMAMEQMRSRLAAVQKTFNSAAEATATAFRQLGAKPQESVQAIRDVADESTRTLLADPNSTILMVADKGLQHGDIAHAMSVMTLSLLVAKHLGSSEPVIQVIGMGALLHDIGTSRLSHSLVRNQARNKFEEASYQTHCQLGHDELRRIGAGVPQAVMDVVMQHHEREDGKGYPGAKAGSAISLPAKLISIADRFDLVVAGEPGSEQLLYAGLDRMGALDVQLMRWASDGKAAAGWVDATGTAAQAEAMRMPVSGGVSSSFGMRTHPVYHRQRFHRGVDLRAGAGTPIHAPAAGRVLYAGWSGGYGRQVRLSHGEGLATTFSHMSRIAAAPGSMVQAGEVIGYVGSTGLSTGPHLHYEVYKNGKAVNPMAARMIGESAMGREERHAFNARLRALLTSSGS